LFKVQEVGVYEPSCNDKDLHGHLCARFSSTWHKMVSLSVLCLGWRQWEVKQIFKIHK
jgi:hypothetical protein